MVDVIGRTSHVISINKFTPTQQRALSEQFGFADFGGSRTSGGSSSDFFSGGNAPYDGNIRTADGRVVAVTSREGQLALKRWNDSKARVEAADKTPQLAIAADSGSFRAAPSTDTRTTPERFVENVTRVEQLGMQTRGEALQEKHTDLFVGEDSQMAKHEESMQIASLTGRPTFAEEKEWRDTVDDYTKERDKYVADIPKAERLGMLARFQSRDLAYAPGVGVPSPSRVVTQSGFSKTTPGKVFESVLDTTPNTKGSKEWYASMGMKPSSFVEIMPEIEPGVRLTPERVGGAKQIFDTKFPKTPTTTRSQIQQNLELPGKVITDTATGISKMTDVDWFGEKIDDPDKFAAERKTDLRKGIGKMVEAFTPPKQPEFDIGEDWWTPEKTFGRTKQVIDYGLGYQFKAAGGMLKGLEVGQKAAGLGFVTIGEPVIGALPDETRLKFTDPFGVERGFSKGGFRRALDIAGQLAWYDALFTAPKAIQATKALATGGKIPKGLRFDEPLRYTLEKSGYLDDVIKAPLDVKGKIKLMSVGDDVTARASAISKDFPQDTFKFKLAKQLGFVDEGTTFTQKYTGVISKGGKDVPDDVAFAFGKKTTDGRDEFSLMSREFDIMKENFTPGVTKTEKGIIGQARSFEEAKDVFKDYPEVIKRIEDTYSGSSFLVKSIDDVPVNLTQFGKPIGGKTQLLSVSKDWDVVRLKIPKGAKWKSGGFTSATPGMDDTKLIKGATERIVLDQEIAMTGQTLGTAKKPITYFRTDDLRVDLTAGYMDDALVKPGGFLGHGKGKVTGLYDIEGMRGMDVKLDLDFLDIKPIKTTGKGIDDLTKGLIDEAGGKESLISQATLSGATPSISVSSAGKTKTITNIATRLAGSISIPTTGSTIKTFSGTTTGAMAALGLTKTTTRTTRTTTTPQGSGTKTVTLTKPSVAQSKMVSNFVALGAITRPTTKRRMVDETKIKTTGLGTITKIRTDFLYAQPTKIRTITGTKSILGTSTKLTPIAVTRPISKLRVGTMPAIKIAPITRVLQKVRPDYKITLPPIVIPPVIVPPIKTPPPVWFPQIKPFKSLPKLKTPKMSGFRLEVKRQGKWRPTFRGAVFTEKSAKGLAQQLVGGTSLASFRISKAYGVPKMVSGLPTFKASQFRMPVRKGKKIASGVYVEKTKFRIDTPGELKGITLKGLKALELYPALRKKKKKKGKKKKGRRKK